MEAGAKVQFVGVVLFGEGWVCRHGRDLLAVCGSVPAVVAVGEAVLSLSPCGLNVVLTSCHGVLCLPVRRRGSGAWPLCGLLAFARPKHDEWACCTHE